MRIPYQGKWFFSGFLMQCIAVSGVALADPGVEKNQSIKKEEIPSEEFWLYMAEFSEEEELIDPEDLMNVRKMNEQNIDANARVKHSAAVEDLPDSNEESL